MSAPERIELLTGLRRLMAALLLALSLLLAFPLGPAADALWLTAASESAPLTHVHGGGLPTALSAWPPLRASVATFTLRDARSSATLAPAHLSSGWAIAWSAVLGAVLALQSPRFSAVGLRWARSLRGPPPLALAR